MPFSTNAPFNESGHAEQLRDIEYLYLKVQELFRAAGINDGDLNPGGGRGTDQSNADDGWGTPPADVALGTGGFSGSTSSAAMVPGLYLALGPTSSRDDFKGWDQSARAYTIPVSGLYLIACSGVVTGFSHNGPANLIFLSAKAVVPRIGNVVLYEHTTCTGAVLDTGGVGYSQGVQFSALVNLVAGDLVKWEVMSDAASPLQCSATCSLALIASP